ncbi:uncharacterized protein ARMOST_22461 [Armillaria ostoyae]|uniref:Uncharacterized protein n=1 Tax=Armillaria ostoyae TaxID=47428 RepID=A0A284SCZ1_ARMOS|nr:uncharacterized protein ARMOST_22461 [Armillaria ostoyae]
MQSSEDHVCHEGDKSGYSVSILRSSRLGLPLSITLSIFNTRTFNMATTNNPTPKEVLAAVTKLASQPGVELRDIEEIISMIDQAHHRFVDSIMPSVGEQGKAVSAAEQKRDALRIQVVSMKQDIIGLAARSDGALQFQDYMRKTGMYWPSQIFLSD